jgi:hypothetical protein
MHIFRYAMLSLVAIAVTMTGMTMTATAQETPTVPEPESPANGTETDRSTGDMNTTAERYIDDNTRIIDSRYNAEEGTASVTIETDGATALTVSDGGALSEGSGEIPSKTVVVDGRQTVTIPATENGGMVGVVISKDGLLYGLVIEPERESPFEKTTPTQGWLGGAVVALSMTGLAAYRVRNSKPDEPEKIA